MHQALCLRAHLCAFGATPTSTSVYIKCWTVCALAAGSKGLPRPAFILSVLGLGVFAVGAALFSQQRAPPLILSTSTTAASTSTSASAQVSQILLGRGMDFAIYMFLSFLIISLCTSESKAFSGGGGTYISLAASHLNVKGRDFEHSPTPHH